MWFRSAGLLLLARLCFAAEFDLSATLRKVESRYNNIRAMQADFEQTLRYASQPRASRTESGTLLLKRPGKMRWDYRSPAKKLFLSDGKDVYFYSPAMNRVEKTKLKETDDMRAPLAFLLGRLDFQRDFREYHIRPEGADNWITAKPKSAKAPYREVQFRLTPDLRIVQLRVVGQDESIMDYTFRNEKLNPPVQDAMFRFQAPAGAEVVDLSAGQ
ncbi:MAG: outer membrane lipoprotein chaperone LolA [Bryobacteraceae bacterium]|nr:outer membrane lipoprotein chaperone LolA [Bryobacteraceae bacterium]